ncbi:cytochrome P460 family protein [Microbulbifer sp. SAOS-129_SWC]|uniref:cytochrome P460 family protein n=1 Tax=Microbulbifer sp. SAOS-129_SWC TaxID=3145235 RepID=UPI003216C50A
MSVKKIPVYLLAIVTALLAAGSAAAPRIDVARFDGADNLQRPVNLDEWIFVGAIVGHGYPDGDARHFSAASPGRIQVVQMEPGAYHYLQQHGEYADGTLLALSFYDTQKKPAPVVDGAVQGALSSFEIHLLDKQKFADRSAFYVFSNDASTAPMIPAGNNCVACHQKDGAYDGTFVQFYPALRDRLLKRALAHKTE